MPGVKQAGARESSTPPPRRRPRRLLIAAAVAVIGVAATIALLMWHPWDVRRLPEVSTMSGRCPASADPVSGPANDPAASLVPDRDYAFVQLCEANAAGQLVTMHALEDEESRTLVQRLNALPARPPAGCDATSAAAAVSLVLSEGAEPVVIRMDTGRCGAVQRSGVVRYGGEEILVHVRRLVA
jgi:hypothetical protein